MNKLILTTAVSLALLASHQPGHAGEVTGLTAFTAGTPARAAEVTGNFTATKTAVDDNYARILALQSNPSISGNLTLAPTTGSDTGIVMKGTVPFLHNFGSANTFLGLSAGNFTMTGSGNTASGRYALQNNTTGNSNTASGSGALLTNTTGSNNTASGSGALQANTTGSNNTASGGGTLASNTTGYYNTASGVTALGNNTSGWGNTASGMNALGNNTTGIVNTALGYRAGVNLATGSYNIAIGNPGMASDSGVIRIGSSTDQIAAFIAGIRGVTTVNANAVPVVVDSAGQLGTISSSRRMKEDIVDMGAASDVLMKLRPVTFHYKAHHNQQDRPLQYGLVAEEVARVAPGLVARKSDGEVETVYYQHLAPMLLNEYQKQQRTIEAQARELAALKREMSAMTAILSRLQQPARVAAVQ